MSIFQKISKALFSGASEAPEAKQEAPKAEQLKLLAPLSGKLVPLEESPDPVFAQKMVGDGVAIDPTASTIVAPCAGTISQVMDSMHAVAVKADNGVEILIHVGIDTVMLKGEGFDCKVSMGDKVEAGQALIEFDAELVGSKAPSLQTAVLVTTGESVTPATAGTQLVAGVDVAFIIGEGTIEAKPAPAAEDTRESITASEDVVVRNPQGLHARPTAQLIQIVRKFESEIELHNLSNDKQCKANSLTAVMSLQTELGAQMKITATGPDAEEALKAVVQGFHDGLGEKVADVVEAPAEVEVEEEEAPLLGLAVTDKSALPGVKAAPGMAIGQLLHRTSELPEYQEYAANGAEEHKLMETGIEKARKGLVQLIEKMNADGMGSHAEVFEAHQEMLEDPALQDRARKHIDAGKSAAWAWHAAYSAEAEELSKLDNAMLAARAADVQDIGLRVLREMLGIETSAASMPENTILVLTDITPSEVVTLDRDRVVGIITIEGGATSHAAILAGSLGLPYLVNVPAIIRESENGTSAILDAGKAKLRLNPTAEEMKECEEKRKAAAQAREEALKVTHEPAITKDGHRVEIAANIGSQEDAEKAVELGAEAVGLLRSEFLYMERVNEPSEAEQQAVYEGILGAMGKERPVIIRTLDVGGDKPLAYLPLPKEENPFLGERGVRIGINRPSMLRKQVRAILKAAHAGSARIMFPMISSLDEFRVVKKLVQEEQEKLGVTDVEIGIMIEVPSAALLADQFAKEVDFFSIGTNDLTQYALAVDRGHPRLAARVDGLHPAVLRLIDMTVKAADREGKWTGICGSLASDPAAVPVLTGLGVQELSVSVPALPIVKAKVRDLNFAECQEMAKTALTLDSAEAVRKLSA